MTIGEKLKVIRTELKLTQEQLAEILGIGKTALSMIETGKANLSKRNHGTLISELNVSQEWLENGNGQIFSADPAYSRALTQTFNKTSDKTIPVQAVPLYDITATAGLMQLFDDSINHIPLSFISIPNLPKCDGAVYVKGDSMYPLLKSGDIVIYKQIFDKENIFWGDMYLISIDLEGDEYVTVKYVQKAERDGYIRLASQNPNFAPKEVSLKHVQAIALVKASIRMNSIR